MSRQKPSCGCLPLFGLLTLAAAGGAYIYFQGFPSVLSLTLPWEPFTPLEAAKVIPDGAIATTYINTEPQAWSKLAGFGTPEAQKLIRQHLEAFRQESSPQAMDYERDLQPWIGDIAIAVVPFPQEDAQLLFVLGIKNQLKAATYAKKFQQQSGRTVTETSYRGIAVSECTSPDSDPFYSAIVGKYLLYSSDRRLIEQAIDTQKGEPSYYDKPGIKELLAQSLSLKNPLLQIYLDDWQFIEQGLSSFPPDIEVPIDTLKNIQPLRAIVLGFGVVDAGVHLQAIAQIDPGTTPASNIQPNSSQLLSFFPEQTLMAINGRGIQQGWRNLVRESEADPALQGAVKQIRDHLKMADLDVDRDVFSWMDREFALGLVASEQPTLGNLGLGGVVIWESRDRKTAQNTLKKLDRLSIFLPQIEVKTQKVAGEDITEWRSKFGQEVFLSYGWLNHESLAMTVAMPFQSILHKPSKTSLPQSQNFKDMTDSLPRKNLGYFYLDIEQSLAKVLHNSHGIGHFLDPESRAVLDSLRGLAMTSTMQNQTTSQVDIIFSLKLTDRTPGQK
jgi:hypothetical protein